MTDQADLRALVERYAHCVDKRDGPALAELFTENGVLVVPDVRHSLEPAHKLRGRTAIADGLEVMRRFDVTMHAVVGQVLEIDGERATGVVSCLAHHVRAGTDTVWFLNYHDTYQRVDGEWCFSRRELWVDWIEERPVAKVRSRADGR